MLKASVSYLTLEFDDFLFARIDEGVDHMPLSVLSAFARLGIDPWEEAASLARLPRELAAKRLVSLIAATPGEPLAYFDARTVSDRLIALLPSPADLMALYEHQPGTRLLTRLQIVTWAIAIASLLVIQLTALSWQAVTHKEGPPPSAASVVIP